MTTEESIKIFEAWAECKYRPTHDAAVLALSALRAQKEREHPMTNADRIRAMSDEELAVWLRSLFISNTCVTHFPGYDFCYDPYGKSNGLKKWLQQPAEEE